MVTLLYALVVCVYVCNQILKIYSLHTSKIHSAYFCPYNCIYCCENLHSGRMHWHFVAPC